MKTRTLFLGILFLLGTSVSAATHTVDNKPGSAAQYDNLQTAIDNAQAGDTILVAGSTSSYGKPIVNKKLTLIGAGYASSPWTRLDAIQFTNQNATAGSSNSFISGFSIGSGTYTFVGNEGLFLNVEYEGMVADSAKLSGITIERCQVEKLTIEAYNNKTIDYIYSDILLRNNLIETFVEIPGQYYAIIDIDFYNNIFNSAYILSYSIIRFDSNTGTEYINGSEVNYIPNVKIANNIFIGGGYAMDLVKQIVVENNIFYGTSLIPQSRIENRDSLEIDINLNNNLFYKTGQTVVDSLLYVTGANNQEEIDPLFVNFPIDGASFSYDHDYHLQEGSPALGAGVGGEDLGIYSGTYPWPATLAPKPKGPKITKVEPVGSPSVPAGGTIQIQFQSTIEE